MEEPNLTKTELVACMNEWMRRYIADPTEFSREFQDVCEFQSEGDAPSYGRDCTKYLLKLRDELAA